MLFHIRIFLQTLRRNVTYTTINITGLATGITASVLIFLWVYHERGFDACYPDVKRIYRTINNTESFGQNRNFGTTSYPFIQACESEIPEIETVGIFTKNVMYIDRITVNHTLFAVGGDAVRVNRACLEMFHSTVLDGSYEAFGNHPFSIALTESGAKKYFGDSRAVGQIIRIEDTDYTVQAVVKDNPTNSSFRFQIMASIDAVLTDPGQQHNRENWGSLNWILFAKLRADADLTQVSQKMTDIQEKGYIKLLKDAGYEASCEVSLESLTDMYFSEVDSLVNGNATMVSIFTLLGILLLCIACINYINLTTARMTQRSKEVGIKKIVGAKRRSLFSQFVAESFIISLIAALIALYLMLISTPLFQMLVGDIPVSFASPVIWIITGIALLFVTALSGVYPALMLSSFHPANSLKGMSLPKVKAGNLRRTLVIFQFFISTALIICVIVIFGQTRYMQNTDPGFRKDNIVRVGLPVRTLLSSGEDHAQLNLQTMKGKLQSVPDIAGVALSSQPIENNRNNYGAPNADWDGKIGDNYATFSPLKVDADFMDIYELQLVEGRWFGTGEADGQNVILNETAIREYGIAEPYIGERFDFNSTGMKGHIIGVMKDFHFRSLHEKITPLVIFQHNQVNYMLNIKIQEGKSAEAVRAIETIWREFFPNDMFEYVFVDDAVTNLYRSDIRTSRMILVFSILAVVIAVLGLFGLSTFAIERRTKEIGIRKVLGASVSSIVQLLTREFIILVAIAFVIAAPVAWWAMNKWLENFAYHVDITVWVFVAGAVVTLVIALIAVGVQAVRAATDNPVKAIKSE
jgi:predicted permease